MHGAVAMAGPASRDNLRALPALGRCTSAPHLAAALSGSAASDPRSWMQQASKLTWWMKSAAPCASAPPAAARPRSSRLSRAGQSIALISAAMAMLQQLMGRASRAPLAGGSLELRQRVSHFSAPGAPASQRRERQPFPDYRNLARAAQLAQLTAAASQAHASTVGAHGRPARSRWIRPAARHA